LSLRNYECLGISFSKICVNLRNLRIIIFFSFYLRIHTPTSIIFIISFPKISTTLIAILYRFWGLKTSQKLIDFCKKIASFSLKITSFLPKSVIFCQKMTGNAQFMPVFARF